jgi:hypothetical protein
MKKGGEFKQEQENLSRNGRIWELPGEFEELPGEFGNYRENLGITGRI